MKTLIIGIVICISVVTAESFFALASQRINGRIFGLFPNGTGVDLFGYVSGGPSYLAGDGNKALFWSTSAAVFGADFASMRFASIYNPKSPVLDLSSFGDNEVLFVVVHDGSISEQVSH